MRFAVTLAVDILSGEETVHGGIITRVALQAGTETFDDAMVTLEMPDKGERTLHFQCRHRQSFGASDKKFRALLRHILEERAAKSAEFEYGRRRFCIVVGPKSPDHFSMRELCNLARQCSDVAELEVQLSRRRGGVAKRWHAALSAAEAGPSELLGVLQSLEIRSADLEVSGADWVETLNRCARLWTPLSSAEGRRLRDALCDYVARTNASGSWFDLERLQEVPGIQLPALAVHTRRNLLCRERRKGTERMCQKLQAAGLSRSEASEVAEDLLSAPPRTTIKDRRAFITGPIGAGKSTEAERLHRAAVDAALRDPLAPVPVFIDARDLPHTDLEPHISAMWAGAVDIEAVGVHLVIDSLDEAGIQYAELRRRTAGLIAQNKATVVFAAGRPEILSQENHDTVVLSTLNPTETATLVNRVDPSLQWTASDAEGAHQELSLPLFALWYALGSRTGKRGSQSRAELVRAAAARVTERLHDEQTYNVLLRVAALSTDRGGKPVPLEELEAATPKFHKLANSGLCSMTESGIQLQLAALTEYFAAESLREHLGSLDSFFLPKGRAGRWRYAIELLLRSISTAKADEALRQLSGRSPATAGWIMNRIDAGPYAGEEEPHEISPGDVVDRVLIALKTVGELFPSTGLLDSHGDSFPMQVASEGGHYEIQRDDASAVSKVEIVPLGQISKRRAGATWATTHYGTHHGELLWPWRMMFHETQSRLNKQFDGYDPLIDLPSAQHELAWHYATSLMDRPGAVLGDPIAVTDMEKQTRELRASVESIAGPVDDVSFRRGDMRLNEAEKFIQDLHSLGVKYVTPPWPMADEWDGDHKWGGFSEALLLERITASTTKALSIYQELVDQSFSRIAPELMTYRLLPVRIVGVVIPPHENARPYGPTISWYTEPLPQGEPNESRWKVSHGSEGRLEEPEQRRMLEATRALRGQDLGFITHDEFFPHVFSACPASDLALSLLHRDLREHAWVSSSLAIRGMKPVRPNAIRRADFRS